MKRGSYEGWKDGSVIKMSLCKHGFRTLPSLCQRPYVVTCTELLQRQLDFQSSLASQPGHQTRLWTQRSWLSPTLSPSLLSPPPVYFVNMNQSPFSSHSRYENAAPAEFFVNGAGQVALLRCALPSVLTPLQQCLRHANACGREVLIMEAVDRDGCAM